MNRIVKVMCLTALVAFVGTNAQAQFRQSIFLNGGLPTGQFASSVSSNHTTVPLYREEIGKAATAGFGLGYRGSYRFDVGMGEVAPFVQADVFWNFIKSSWSDKYIQAKGKAPNYFNIPVMAGVSYLYDEMWNDITLYAEFGVGADLFIIGSEKAEFIYPATSESTIKTFSYKPTVALSWMFGVGAYFGRHVSAGVYYYGFGKHVVSYTKKTYNGFDNTLQATIDKGTVPTRTVGELALRIGFHF